MTIADKSEPLSPAPERPSPETTTQPRPLRRARRLSLRAWRLTLRVVLALTALAVFASPFALAFYLNYRGQWIGPQVSTPPAPIPAGELSQFRAAATAAAAAPAPRAPAAEPIVLSYHDVTRNSISQYSVTPAQFAAQMKMLHAAGYHALTAGQLIRYLHGGSVPNRSVAITFDDGSRGLWTYADKTLRRYGLHGISFLITSRVGTHLPYYLTWQEIRLMHASGRWDFESHTNNLVKAIPVSSPGQAFRTRLRADLLTSIRDLTRNQLPRPALFAYPFPDRPGTPAGTAGGDADQLVHELFAAAMTNYTQPPVPVSRREAASGLISRLEVTSSDTAASLFSHLRQIASLPTADARGLSDRGRWRAENGQPADVSVTRHRLAFAGARGRWTYASYDPGASADWDGYRLTTQVTGLSQTADQNSTISVRLDSAAQLNVTVGNHYVEVRLGSLAHERVAAASRLSPRRDHQVSIEVRPLVTVVFVDGRTIMRKRVFPGPSSTGGFAAAAFRPQADRPFPRLTSITLRRLAQ